MYNFLETYNYSMIIILMMLGFYCIINSSNLIKKLIGLSVFQTSALLLYISAAKIKGAVAPIVQFSEDKQPLYGEAAEQAGIIYNNPLPHVLILTAIVVGVALVAVGLALIILIKEQYKTVDEIEILEIEQKISK